MNDSEDKAEIPEDRNDTVAAGEPQSTDQQPSMPEPPLRYNVDGMQQPNLQQPSNFQQIPNPQYVPNPIPANAEYVKIRRMVGAAQILAIVSLLIGGVVLSTVALIVAIVAYSKTRNQIATDSDPIWLPVKRAATIGIVLSVGALALNAISIIVFYPMLNEIFNSMNISGATAGGSSSTWG